MPRQGPVPEVLNKSRGYGMEFLTGKDYPWLCEGCRSAVDQCAEEMAVRVSWSDGDVVSGRLLIDLADQEAPMMLVGDRGMFCGGHECGCDCQGDRLDVLCPVHGGTEEEQQAFYAQECEKNGHHFPYMRDGYCLSCRKAYGQALQIVVLATK
jgi:hypothetical protein